MSVLTKTTLYLPSADYRRLKALARREGKATAELLREVLAAYARRRAVARLPHSLGAGRSGRRDLSECVESLLGG